MCKSDPTAILVAGLAAGTIDIGAAALINLANPILILHFIAGGLLGRPSKAEQRSPCWDLYCSGQCR